MIYRMRAVGAPCLFALLASVFSPACTQRQSPLPRDAALAPPAGAARGSFSLTYYWVATEEPDQAPVAATATLYDAACGVLATVSSRFASDVATAGTGRLRDGRLLTVDGDCTCPFSPCFRFEKTTGWGLGASNRPLVPFRSLAVDRGVIPIGTHLWIEELAGVIVPGGYPDLHDGCVVADDIGGRIAGDHIDWFVGTQASYRELDHLLHLARVTVHDGGKRCP
jgi:3D (Asp-Asp-Asp) domain-containing protein